MDKRKLLMALAALALAAGMAACGGGAGTPAKNWYSLGKSVALLARRTANLNTTYDGTTADTASAWCADIMFLPQSASFKAKLLASVPKAGADSRQWVKGCEAGAPKFSAASTSAPSASGGSSGGASSEPSAGGPPPAASPTYTYQDGWNAAAGVSEVDLMAAAGQSIPPTDALGLFDANYCRLNDPTGAGGGDEYFGGTDIGGSQWFVGCVSELVANPPAPPVITSSSPGYSEGYAIGQQTSEGAAPGAFASYGGATGWCDEYADPELEYAPQVAGVGTDANPADDPAIVGCIAAMNAGGVQ